MNDKTRNGLTERGGTYDALYTALRREESDARISELLQVLRTRGQGPETVATNVMRKLGPQAVARVKRVANARGQHMATGTWQRYRMSRSRRLRLWLRGLQDEAEDLVQRLRSALQRG